jgi:hypothetical protein
VEFRIELRSDRNDRFDTDADQGLLEGARGPDHSVAKVVQRRVLFAVLDREVQIIEDGQQCREKAELALFSTVLERFHHSRAHVGRLFFEAGLYLLKLRLNADKFRLGGLASVDLGL